MKRWGRIIFQSLKNWSADNALKHAASVSFYALFSLAPLAIIALSVAGLFFGAEAAKGELAEQLASTVGKDGAAVIEKAVANSQMDDAGWFSTVVGVGMLLLGATTVFAQLQESLNQIWGVVAAPRRSGIIILFIRRLVSLALVLTIGFLLLVSLLLSAVVAAAVEWAGERIPVPDFVLIGAEFIVSLGIITVLFAMIFKVLPDVRLRWKDVWRGGFITALLFSGGKYLISLYIARSTLASTYGAAGSLVAVLLWVYYSCTILFFGVELTRAYLAANNVEVHPKSTAVRVRREIVKEAEAV